MEELNTFIQTASDPRELKRALAVRMAMQSYPYREIRAVLQVSIGFITKWKQRYEAQGAEGLQLAYRGSQGYLSPHERQAVIEWLQEKNCWQLGELQHYVESRYDVVFESKQSYYTLFAAAGISWKKTQKRNPKTDPIEVEKKTGDYSLAGHASS